MNEFNARANRSGVPGFYIHVTPNDLEMIRAIRYVAIFQGKQDLIDSIDSFARDFGLDVRYSCDANVPLESPPPETTAADPAPPAASTEP